MNPQNFTTRLSLLGRLKDQPDDQESWAEFVSCYEPIISRWCRTLGLQHADANDVSQDVLLKIAKHMRRFQYKPGGRFRSWLKTVVRNAWHDFVTSRKEKGSGDETVHQMLYTVEATDELLQQIDQEYEQQLLHCAMTAVQARVEPHIWQAFELLAIKQVHVDAVAQQLSITVGNAYVSKSRVQKMLTEEVSRLSDAFG